MERAIPKGCPYGRSLTALGSDTPLWDQTRICCNSSGRPRLGSPRAIRKRKTPTATHRHRVSGDVVLLAVLDHLLQVWAVVRLSICDYNHYSLCPFPATFLKRFRAASEEMPCAAQPGQAGRGPHRRARAETPVPAETRAPSPVSESATAGARWAARPWGGAVGRRTLRKTF